MPSPFNSLSAATTEAGASFDLTTLLPAATTEAGASLDLITLLRSFCDASGPFSPRPPSPPPIFQSPILSDAFATFDSLSRDSPLPYFLFPHFAHTLTAMPATGSEDAARPRPIILARCFQPSMITSSLSPLHLRHFLFFFSVLFISFSPSLPMSGFKRFDILDLLLQCLLPFPPLISLLNFFNSTTDLILIDRLVRPSTILRCLQEWPETKRCLQDLSDRVVALELEFDQALGSSRYKWRAEIKEESGGRGSIESLN